MGSRQDRSQDQATPIAVEPSTSTPPRILVDSRSPASQAPSATSPTQSRVSPTYMIPASSASDIGHRESFPSSIALDQIPSLAQSSVIKNERESPARHHFTLKVVQHARIGLALGDERSSAKSSRVPPLDPPIVCELIADTPAGASLFGILELALRATLVDGMSPERVIGPTSAGLRPLHGDVDQSAFIAPIFTRTEQSLFIFSELGVRPTGDFRIRLDLVDRSGITFINLGCVYTDRFVVVGDKSSHPGLSPSSDLMHAIVRRGLKLRLTKASKEEAPLPQGKAKKKTSISSTKRRVESPGSSHNEWIGTSRTVTSPSSGLAQQYPSERPQTAEAEAAIRDDPSRALHRSPADLSGSSSPRDSPSRISSRPGIVSRASAPGRSSPLPLEPTPHVLRATASLPRLPASSTRSDPVRPWEQSGSYLPPLRLAGSEEQYPSSRLPAQLPPLQSLSRPSSMRLPAMGPPALPSLYQPQQQQQHQHQLRYHTQLPQQPPYQQYHQPQQQYPRPQLHQYQYQYQHQLHQQQRQSHDPHDQDIIMGPPPIPAASSSSSSSAGSGSQEDYPSNRPRLPSIQHVLNAAGDPGPRPSSRERHPLSAISGAGTGIGDGAGAGASGALSMEGSAEEGGARRGHGGRQAGERWPWGQGHRQ